MNQVFDGRRGIQYLGQYKPTAPCPLVNGFAIVPAGSGMFSYGPIGQVNLNVCYFVGPDGISDTDLSEAFRHWLVFDSFLLGDHFSIYFFDEGKIGAVDVVPADILSTAQGDGYKQVDYGNIANQVFWPPQAPEGLPVLAYPALFERYKALPSNLQEMIEWSVSYPFRSHTRISAFFNTKFWELIHAVILLEKLIGRPPVCEKTFGQCACGYKPEPHNSISRKKWLRQFLSSRVASAKVVEEYAKVVEEAISIRNKMAHTPQFDRSVLPELSPGEQVMYGIDEAIKGYKHDSVALESLLISVKKIARYLLLDEVFATRYFPNLKPLNTVLIKGDTP